MMSNMSSSFLYRQEGQQAGVFDCFYGGPASGKSVSITQLIEDVYLTTGKKSRVWVGDGSSMSYHALMKAGVVDLCEYNMMDYPRTILHNIVHGAWLVENRWVWPDETDPVTGWKNDLSQVGVWVCEGLTVMGSYLMGHAKGAMAWCSANNIKIGQDSPIRFIDGIIDPKTGKLLEGPGTPTGGNSPSHYQVAQNLLAESAHRTRKLPVDYVIWTAHEGYNDPEKDLNREPVVAPAVPGRVLTGQVQKLFNNTLHMVSVPKRVKAQDSHTGRAIDELDLEYRLYTRDHFSATGASTVRFKACTRVGDNRAVPQYLVAETPGTAVLEYYQLLRQIIQENADRIAQKVAMSGKV